MIHFVSARKGSLSGLSFRTYAADCTGLVIYGRTLTCRRCFQIGSLCFFCRIHMIGQISVLFATGRTNCPFLTGCRAAGTGFIYSFQRSICCRHRSGICHIRASLCCIVTHGQFPVRKMLAALRIFRRIFNICTGIYGCTRSFFDVNECQCIWLIFRYTDVFVIQSCGRRITCDLCRTFACTGPDTVSVCKRRIHFICTGLGRF